MTPRFPTDLQNGNVPYRLTLVETELEKITDSVNKLTAAVQTLAVSIGKHDERRAFWNKVAVGVVSTAVLGVIGFLLRLSWFVQMARSP